MSGVTIVDSLEKTAKLIYCLYLAGLLLGGVTCLVGVVMAYIYKDEAPEWLQTHYQFQVRTFWMSVLWLTIGWILTFVLIGFFVLLFWVVWFVVRCVKGLKVLNRQAAHPDPTSWLF